ncbi:hypothetical protein GGTG_10802 [Gaeumannomyces tritici R3-111a-1]|uniref:Uncharacterized protein n=1 Tax=Gaeumannomyces tritici (strain R3-111a-1) TaxID=644352 RepID=J3PBC9_GAET3|nr:hypothetical protein GGTG_10802 [Gaeumannomyces tritici R3-111a-1]EJT71545.1 hypothetical protein GGTG_10802 [Gaeumannomyces tritici R3-111a-1]
MQRAPLRLLGRAVATASTRQAYLPGVRAATSSPISNAHPTLHGTPNRRLHTTSSDPASTPPPATGQQGDSNMASEDTTTTTTTAAAAKLPALPEPGSGDDAPTHQLDLSSGQGSVTLDHLGPMVVNRDGTMSRIANWAEMSDIERQNTLRILGKRNQLRLGDLRAAKAREEEEAGAGAAAGAEGKAKNS